MSFMFRYFVLCVYLCVLHSVPMANTHAGNKANELLITTLNLHQNQIYDAMNNAIASMFPFIEK